MNPNEKVYDGAVERIYDVLMELPLEGRLELIACIEAAVTQHAQPTFPELQQEDRV
jgi:hypothetical protein